MSTLIIATIIILTIAAICALLILIDKKQKRNAMNHFLHRLSRAGSANNLTFSSQEVLKNSAIGLDGLHRKLLVLTRFKDGEYFDVVIDLDEVKSCSVKKGYVFVNGSDVKSNKPEQHLEEIVLRVEFDNGEEAGIPFYSHVDNPLYQLVEMEQKAKQWETILSKMLKDHFRKTA